MNPESGRGDRYSQLWIWLGVVGVVVAVALGELQELRVLQMDSGVYAYIGKRLLQGKMLYTDLWDHKLPAIHLLNALVFAVFPDSVSSIHLFEMVWSVATSLAFYKVARLGFSRRQSLVMMVLFAFFSNLRALHGGGNHPENYGLLPTIVFYYCLLARWSEFRWRQMLMAGLAWGASTLLRPTAGLHILALLPLLMSGDIRRGSSPTLRSLSSAAVVGLGALLVWAPVVLWILIEGAFQEFYSATFLYNIQYARSASLVASVTRLRSSLYSLFPQVGFLWLPAALALWLMLLELRAHFRREATSTERLLPGSSRSLQHTWTLSSNRSVFWTVMTTWFLCSVIELSMGGRFFQWYFLVTVPASVMLSGFAAQELWAAADNRPWHPKDPRNAFIAIVLMALSILPISSQLLGLPQAIAYTKGAFDRESAWETADPLQNRIASLLKERTRIDEPIFVWGAQAAIYLQSDRHPPTRYVYIFPVTGQFGGQQHEGYPRLVQDRQPIEELERALGDTPPKVFALEARFSSGLIGTQVSQLLQSEYDLLAEIDGWLLYERKA